jgi:hypothetical protein
MVGKRAGASEFFLWIESHMCVCGKLQRNNSSTSQEFFVDVDLQPLIIETHLLYLKYFC